MSKFHNLTIKEIKKETLNAVSILFDIPITEAKHIIPQLQSVLEAGNFPVKTKVGNIYSKMREL